MKCNCCNQEKGLNVRRIEIPLIGYGGPFDTIDKSEAISFTLCENCLVKINKYIASKKVNPREFWDFRIYISDNFIQHFQYEDLLWKVLHKFMPHSLEGRMLSISDRIMFMKMARNRKKGGDRY